MGGGDLRLYLYVIRIRPEVFFMEVNLMTWAITIALVIGLFIFDFYSMCAHRTNLPSRICHLVAGLCDPGLPLRHFPVVYMVRAR